MSIITKRAKTIVILMVLVVCAFSLTFAAETQSVIPISKCTITLSKAEYTYTGKECKPIVWVKYGSKNLKKETDYSLTK